MNVYRINLFLFLTFHLFLLVTNCYCQGYKLINVTALSVKKTDNADTILYQVSFKTKLKTKKDFLYIDEYGIIKKNSTIHFLTGNKYFTLYDKNHGILRTIQLDNITYLQAADELTFPEITDFNPNIFREEVIRNDSTFDDLVREVLNNNFPIGTTRSIADDKTVIITPFISLKLPSSSTKVGEIAFKVIYRFKKGAHILYHISTTTRQRRSHERTWTPVTEDNITEKANELLNELINQLNK